MFLAFDDDSPTRNENGILLPTLLEASAGAGFHSHFDESSPEPSSGTGGAWALWWRGPTRRGFIQQSSIFLVMDGEIEVVAVPTELIHADNLTKPKPRANFEPWVIWIQNVPKNLPRTFSSWGV
jgi:hypothetical protein